MFCVFPLCCWLVVSTSVISCLERKTCLWNGALCVEWDVKPYTLTHSLALAQWHCSVGWIGAASWPRAWQRQWCKLNSWELFVELCKRWCEWWVCIWVFTRLSHQHGYKVASCINCTNITPSGAQLLTTGRKDNAWGLDVGDWRKLGRWNWIKLCLFILLKNGGVDVR